MIHCPFSGATIREPRNLDTGEVSFFMSEFIELNCIGAGSFGCVCRCRNRTDNKEYAVKKIVIDKPDWDYAKVRVEILALSSLNHPRVVRYHQAWAESCISGLRDVDDDIEDHSDDDMSASGPCLYIVQEYCPSTLARLLKRGPLHVDKAWELFIQIAEALQHIHEKNIIHRDVNPNNIFLDYEENIKVGDFGIAQISEAVDSTMDMTNLGVPPYQAPELFAGEEFDDKSDIYSLGVISVQLFNHLQTTMEESEVISKWKNPNKRSSLKMDVLNRAQIEFLSMLVAEVSKDRPSAETILAIKPWEL